MRKPCPDGEGTAGSVVDSSTAAPTTASSSTITVAINTLCFRMLPATLVLPLPHTCSSFPMLRGQLYHCILNSIQKVLERCVEYVHVLGTPFQDVGAPLLQYQK